MANFKIFYLIFIFLSVLSAILAPPVKEQDPEDPTLGSAPDTPSQAQFDLEYKKYLNEVVILLESDPEFKKKLENATDDDIQSGAIVRHLNLVKQDVRTKLDELKRMELERLNYYVKIQRDNLTTRNDMFDHLDVKNAEKFDESDFKKLILKFTSDMEKHDQARREEYKKFEMEKEFNERQRTKTMTPDELNEFEKKKKENATEMAKPHPDVHHPMNKEQLEEVWQNDDGLSKQDFDLKTLFRLHDLDSNGFIDQKELEALLLNELNKVYPDKLDPEKKSEEMSRMREHVFKEMDKNRDTMLSLDEFLSNMQTPEYNNDPGWKTLDEQGPSYSQDEYMKYEREKLSTNVVH